MKDRNKRAEVSSSKLQVCLILGVVSLAAAVVLVAVDPIPIVARVYTRISQGSFVLEFFKKKIDAVHISLFIFNITNAEQFMSGEDHKLRVEEVGPFTYREIIHIENLELDEGAGEMRYSPRIESVFMPEESIGYPEDFNVTTPNMALLGLTSIISRYPYLIRMGFNILVRQRNSKAIRTIDARSYLWGISDPILKLTSSLVPGLMVYDKIGFFDYIYHPSLKNNLVVGATEKDKFMIKTRNGYKKLMISDLEDTDKCNKCDTFENTYEGMMYPSPVLPETPIRLYRSGFCKIIDTEYQERKVLENGVEGLVFRVKDSFFTDGQVDISHCIFGFPISLTKAHYVNVDPKLYERVEGIKPSPDKSIYDIYIMVEPISGVEIDTYTALQVNLPLGDLTFNPETRRFSNMLLPSTYAVIKQPELDEEIMSVIKKLYYTLPLLVLFSRITLFLLSFSFLAYFGRQLHHRKFSGNATTFPILTKLDGKNTSVKVAEPFIAK